MSWRNVSLGQSFCRLALFALPALLLSTAAAFAADDAALWREYGLVHSEVAPVGRATLTSYEMKDPTGALAAWEWQRSPAGHTCDLAPFCNQDGDRTVLSDFNYVLVFERGVPSKDEVNSAMQSLQHKRDSSLPAILTFLPQAGLVANSARYILGPVSAHAFTPELDGAKLGFEQGAEAQTAAYRIRKDSSPVRLVLLNYPTPEMARMHTATLKKTFGESVKRSDVLVVLTLPPATPDQSAALLSRVQYEAKVTWNETPPPSPIKPLYQLLLNIIYLSTFLGALCLFAGLIYAGMRIYRRRYGTLDSDEAMTTLHLTE